MTTAAASKHLKSLLGKRAGSTDAQIVFLDVVSYSKRKSTVQKALVERFQRDVKEALNIVGRNYIEYSQANDLNFSNDVIRIPTGDGAALAFTFDGVQGIALDFAVAILQINWATNAEKRCEKFDDNSWCNCHSYYNLRVGINEGKAIIFNDMNDQVNVAGTCINLAARVMGLGDSRQIILTEQSYLNLIDMTADVALEEQFNCLGPIKIKNSKRIIAYQFLGNQLPFISADVPTAVIINKKMDSMASSFGFIDSLDDFGGDDKTKSIQLVDNLAKMADIISGLTKASVSPSLDQLRSAKNVEHPASDLDQDDRHSKKDI